MHVDVLLVALVVGRVRLGHPDDVALLDLGRIDEADRRELAGGQLDQLLVGHLPELVALEDEVLESQAGLAVVHQVGRPRAVVLDASDVHLGAVDVDPVVGEAGRLGHDQRDGEEVPVGEIVGRGLRRRPGAGGSIALSSAENGIDDTT